MVMKTKTSLLILLTAVLGALVSPMSADAATNPDIPDPNQNFVLTGAGATFPFPLIDLWRVEYKNSFDNVDLNYQSIGSGGGIKQHIETTVNFAASDKPLKEAERELAPGTLHIPESNGDNLFAQEGDTLYVEYVDTTLPRVGANGELNSKSDTLDIIGKTSVTSGYPYITLR